MTNPNSELVEHYAGGPGVIRQAVAALSPGVLDLRQPGAWSAREIIAHVADAEAVRAVRIRLILAEDMPDLFVFDENRWTERLGQAPRDPEVALAAYEAMVRSTAEAVAGSLPSGLERTGRHPEDGAITVRTLIERGINHVREHAEQIRGL